MNLTLHKFDELDSLINGIEYIEDNNLDSECYFFLNPRSPNHCQKVTYDFSNPYPFLVSPPPPLACCPDKAVTVRRLFYVPVLCIFSVCDYFWSIEL